MKTFKKKDAYTRCMILTSITALSVKFQGLVYVCKWIYLHENVCLFNNLEGEICTLGHSNMFGEMACSEVKCREWVDLREKAFRVFRSYRSSV